MENLLTQETPGKVIGLAGACLFSLAFLFAVTATNQSFGSSEYALANPFSPENVVAVIDGTANGYANFVAMNFTGPLQSDLSALAYNSSSAFAYLSENTGDQFSHWTGLNDLAYVDNLPVTRAVLTQGQVAGAFISQESQ